MNDSGGWRRWKLWGVKSGRRKLEFDRGRVRFYNSRDLGGERCYTVCDGKVRETTLDVAGEAAWSKRESSREGKPLGLSRMPLLDTRQDTRRVQHLIVNLWKLRIG